MLLSNLWDKVDNGTSSPILLSMYFFFKKRLKNMDFLVFLFAFRGYHDCIIMTVYWGPEGLFIGIKYLVLLNKFFLSVSWKCMRKVWRMCHDVKF